MARTGYYSIVILVLTQVRLEIMKTISLKLMESLDEKLVAVAAKQGVSKSALVREALETYIQNEKSSRPGSCLELAKDLFGSVEGPPDLSFHKKYMKGFGR